MSGQGEVSVTVPNDADPLRDGPIDRRLTWKEPTQLALTQPTNRPRDQPTWDSLCVATDFGTGQIQGEVGTPENPRFTYEEAVHNQRSGKGMTLYTGEDIVQLEGDELIQRSGPKLKKLRLAVEESELPLLPQGVLPGGWDALRRPWALMDCPAAQVPQIPSAHSHSRLTVAIMVSFPPEPLYFPNLAHMDLAVQVWNKASQKKPLGMSDELHADGRMKGAKRTYERLLLPGYHHSVPVQEAWKEVRWADFRDGHWGNRENSPAPAGDVQPAHMMETPPAEKQTAAAASGSAQPAVHNLQRQLRGSWFQGNPHQWYPKDRHPCIHECPCVTPEASNPPGPVNWFHDPRSNQFSHLPPTAGGRSRCFFLSQPGGWALGTVIPWIRTRPHARES